MCPGGRVFNVNKEFKKFAVHFDFDHSNLGKVLLCRALLTFVLSIL